MIRYVQITLCGVCNRRQIQQNDFQQSITSTAPTLAKILVARLHCHSQVKPKPWVINWHSITIHRPSNGTTPPSMHVRCIYKENSMRNWFRRDTTNPRGFNTRIACFDTELTDLNWNTMQTRNAKNANDIKNFNSNRYQTDWFFIQYNSNWINPLINVSFQTLQY